MTEKEWTAQICAELQIFFKQKDFFVETQRKIPYSQEIDWYSEGWLPNHMNTSDFETDLVIYEVDAETHIKPRVIIESKIRGVTTHDAITYSYKAEKHKSITPYIRYGIMLGERKNYPLPGRLFRHGTNFDFMFSFAGLDPTDDEWNSFIEMIKEEIKFSKTLEEMLHENKRKDRKHYYMLQKQLILKEMDE